MEVSARQRKLLNIFFHALMFGLVFVFSLELKYETVLQSEHSYSLLSLLLLVVFVKVAAFYLLGLFSGWWRYVSLPDLGQLVKANALASAVLLLLTQFDPATAGVLSLSVLWIDMSLCFLVTSGVRVAVRLWCEKRCQIMKHRKKALKRVLVVGAGATGQTIVREIRQCTRLNQKVVGFIDDDPLRQDQSFQGVPVVGTQRDLERICGNYNINTVIVAHNALCPRELKEIVERCRNSRVQVKILPAMGEILNGNVSVKKIRDVQIEDLLGRAPIGLEARDVQTLVQGKCVLISGAGGSIGGEICRQLVPLQPAQLILFDHGETSLFYIERELRRLDPHLRLQAVLGDVRDERLVRRVFAEHAPAVVFHAAAYKHVGMSEKNPAQAVQNNVFGTVNLARASGAYGAQTFVLVSTDKAVNPTNIMGASKRCAEQVVQYFSRRNTVRYVTVRFGNVLGSNGSVVEVFREQIAAGGPVTVTHPEVTRFFMTIPEAVNLVLHAGLIGEKGHTYLLDMGESVKILKLAEEMIRLSGLRPYDDIDIVYSGLGQGEKLYEELLLSGEGITPTRHEKIWAARQGRVDDAVLEQALREFESSIEREDESKLRATLKRLVPEFLGEGEVTPLRKMPEKGEEIIRPFVPSYLSGYPASMTSTVHRVSPGS